MTFAEFDAFVVTTDRAIKLPTGTYGRGDMPVINVGWDEAKAYADWLGARAGNSCKLPSEAEWEYACKAGTDKDFGLPAPIGSDEIKDKDLANCADCGAKSPGRTTAVKTFPANGWGLYDMHGNVWEWASDCAEVRGVDCAARAVRGGSWPADADLARCGFRGWNAPFSRGGSLGFRVLCSSPIPGH